MPTAAAINNVDPAPWPPTFCYLFGGGGWGVGGGSGMYGRQGLGRGKSNGKEELHPFRPLSMCSICRPSGSCRGIIQTTVAHTG